MTRRIDRKFIRRARDQIAASIELSRTWRQAELFDATRNITHSSLGLPNGWLKGLAPADLERGAEWCLRQTVWSFGRKPFGAFSALAIALTGRPVTQIAALPPSWRARLEAHGVRVARLRSQLAWLREQCAAFVSGLRRVAFYLLTSNERLPQPQGRYAVLHYARPLNLPPPNCPPPHWDWATWTRKAGLVGPDDDLWASWSDGTPSYDGKRRLRRTLVSLPRFRTAAAHRAFRLELIRLTFAVMGRWLTGAWWAPLLFRDLVELAHCRAAETDDLADSYFFPPQNMQRRPLWTWCAEARGARTALVFYSHNFQVVFHPERADEIIIDAAYSLTCWPEIVFMTEECSRVFVAAGAEPHRAIAAGPVAMIDSGDRAEKFERPAIAILDIDPMRPGVRAAMGLTEPYNTKAIVREFLEEVTAAVVEAGATPVWKLKGAMLPEHAVSPTDMRYDRRAHLEIARRHDPVVCRNGIPVHQLATQVDAAIVMPFTSPATVFRQFGVPAAYFDPTGRLGKHSLMARGAPILTDRQALRAWLADVVAARMERRKVGT